MSNVSVQTLMDLIQEYWPTEESRRQAGLYFSSPYGARRALDSSKLSLRDDGLTLICPWSDFCNGAKRENFD